jgi:hypothetical protein
MRTATDSNEARPMITVNKAIMLMQASKKIDFGLIGKDKDIGQNKYSVRGE